MAESLRRLLTPPKAHYMDPDPPMLDLAPLAAHLSELTTQTEAALNDGTRMPLEENLITQARMLDAVFQKMVHHMAHRGFNESTLRTTLNAQRQYRYTVESLRKAPKNTPNELNKP